jgi:hypothetical protein
LELNAAGCGVGEHKASAEAKGKAGGFKGVSARRNVVHKIGLAERQRFAGAGKVVLLWRDRAKGVLVAGALGLYGLRPVNRFRDLCPGNVPGDVVSKAGVGVRVSGAVGYRHKPARGPMWVGHRDECGHFAGGGVEVSERAGQALNRVGKAADLGLVN